MKAKVLIPLLILAPTLCACHGLSISNEDALAILKNIEEEIKKGVPFTNFVEVHKNKNNSSEIEERKFFNKDAKFLHQYRIIVNSDLSESWTYVKDNYIYDVNRNTTGAIDPGDTPTYTITSKVPYSDSAWKNREDSIVNNVFSFYSTAIENCRKFTDNKEVTVEFQSKNVNSIYVTARQKVEAAETKEILFNYEFDNSLLIKQSRQDSTTVESYDWSYGDVKVAYPAVEEK